MVINSQFTYLWLGQTLSQLATNLSIFFIGFFLYKKTSSNILVSLTLLTFLIPSSLSSFLAGVVVSRMGKKWVLFLSNLLRSLIILLMFFLERNIIYLYLLMFFLALVAQFFSPAESSIIPQLVPKNRLITANAYFSITSNLTLVAAIFLSPLFFKFYGFKALLLVFAMFILSAVCIYLLRLSEPLFYTNFNQPVNGLLKKFQYHVSLIFKKFLKNNKINRNFFNILLFQIVIFILIALAPGFADKVLRIPVEDLSFLIVFPVTVGFILGSFAISFLKKIEQNKLIRFCFFSVSFLFFAIFVESQLIKTSSSFFNLVNFFLLLGFGFFAQLVVITSYANLQKKTEKSEIAGYFGLLNAFVNLASIIPVLLSGILSDMFGVDKVVFLLGLIFLTLTARSFYSLQS